MANAANSSSPQQLRPRENIHTIGVAQVHDAPAPKYDKTWVPDRVHAQSALIYLNSDELDYEVGSSESSRGSSSVTARFATIEASPEFAWNDDPQPVRLATRRADLCATVEEPSPQGAGVLLDKFFSDQWYSFRKLVVEYLADGHAFAFL
ncbi:hypothetical protein E4U60_005182 [Claviceps pazoutovae]|uniref:Uncharacterized protein n=1 Tax=Claviceps pazoutovae TaxID=1649127 RepID=A0A9P7SFB9_9HYPO|nr:hypothetical protein E4U60_005182 [Claviceps pazoutovae]